MCEQYVKDYELYLFEKANEKKDKKKRLHVGSNNIRKDVKK